MQTYLRRQIDWPQPFPAEEYQARREKVRKALAAKKIDALYVTMPANLNYLLGYDMIWYHLRCLTGLLIRADSVEDPCRMVVDLHTVGRRAAAARDDAYRLEVGRRVIGIEI